ncbi:MAG: DUF4126 domain-containing protein [Caldilineaceae bacterium]|nr:DUF4126 domain-containing protein [Caldilineaceae bacterium]
MDILLSLAVGLGLAAAVGFRVFVPFTIISVAAMSGHLNLAPGFDWIGTYPALIAFGTATLLEILAYYIPWVDNLLDSVATPVAVVAGVIITASVVGDVSPWLRWSLAVIAGGGIAGIIQSGTVLLRGASSMTTGGLGNVVVSSAELLGSVLASILALLFPLIALALLIALVIWFIGRRRERSARGQASLSA